MTYLIDGRALQDRSRMRGIGSYVRGLLRGFHELGVDSNIELLLNRGADPPELATLSAHVARRRLLRTKRRIQPVVDPFLIAAALRSVCPTLYHSPDYAQPITAPCPVVITVHDLIPFVMPTLYPWLRRERLLALRLLRRADALIADSESTAADLRRLAHVDTERIHVVPLGITPPKAPATQTEIGEMRAKHGISRPFLLAVAAFDPRKGIDDLTAIAAEVRTRHDIELVIVGDQGIFDKKVHDSVRNAGLSDHAKILGYVSANDLAALYADCACLVFTSSYEGFGLPPLEAMAAGAPVAMYMNSSLRETAGNAAILAEDGNADALAKAVIALLDNPQERQVRVARGVEWSKGFTWKRTAQMTLDVYERVLAAHKMSPG